MSLIDKIKYGDMINTLSLDEHVFSTLSPQEKKEKKKLYMQLKGIVEKHQEQLKKLYYSTDLSSLWYRFVDAKKEWDRIQKQGISKISLEEYFLSPYLERKKLDAEARTAEMNAVHEEHIEGVRQLHNHPAIAAANAKILTSFAEHNRQLEKEDLLEAITTKTRQVMSYIKKLTDYMAENGNGEIPPAIADKLNEANEHQVRQMIELLVAQYRVNVKDDPISCKEALEQIPSEKLATGVISQESYENLEHFFLYGDTSGNLKKKN